MFETKPAQDNTIIKYFDTFVTNHIEHKVRNGQTETAWLLTDAMNIINILTQHCFDYGIGIPNKSICESIHTEDYVKFNEEIIDEK